MLSELFGPESEGRISGRSIGPHSARIDFRRIAKGSQPGKKKRKKQSTADFSSEASTDDSELSEVESLSDLEGEELGAVGSEGYEVESLAPDAAADGAETATYAPPPAAALPPAYVVRPVGGAPPLEVPAEALGPLLGAYETLRAFSWQLHLSPFSFDAFCAAMSAETATFLVDETHVCVLRALMIDETPRERAQHALDPLFLDALTWPAFVWDWLRLCGSPLTREEWRHRLEDRAERRAGAGAPEAASLDDEDEAMSLDGDADDEGDPDRGSGEDSEREEAAQLALVDVRYAFGARAASPPAALARLRRRAPPRPRAAGEYYALPLLSKARILETLCNCLLDCLTVRAELDRRMAMDQMTAGYLRPGSERARQEVVSVFSLADDDAPDAPDACVLCGVGGSLLCCDGCAATYHARCVGETARSLGDGEWLCPECVAGGRAEAGGVRVAAAARDAWRQPCYLIRGTVARCSLPARRGHGVHAEELPEPPPGVAFYQGVEAARMLKRATRYTASNARPRKSTYTWVSTRRTPPEEILADVASYTNLYRNSWGPAANAIRQAMEDCRRRRFRAGVWLPTGTCGNIRINDSVAPLPISKHQWLFLQGRVPNRRTVRCGRCYTCQRPSMRKGCLNPVVRTGHAPGAEPAVDTAKLEMLLAGVLKIEHKFWPLCEAGWDAADGGAGQRSAWSIAARAAGSVPELAATLCQLEGALRPVCCRRAWGLPEPIEFPDGYLRKTAGGGPSPAWGRATWHAVLVAGTDPDRGPAARLAAYGLYGTEPWVRAARAEGRCGWELDLRFLGRRARAPRLPRDVVRRAARRAGVQDVPELVYGPRPGAYAAPRCVLWRARCEVAATAAELALCLRELDDALRWAEAAAPKAAPRGGPEAGLTILGRRPVLPAPASAERAAEREEKERETSDAEISSQDEEEEEVGSAEDGKAGPPVARYEYLVNWARIKGKKAPPLGKEGPPKALGGAPRSQKAAVSDSGSAARSVKQEATPAVSVHSPRRGDRPASVADTAALDGGSRLRSSSAAPLGDQAKTQSDVLAGTPQGGLIRRCGVCVQCVNPNSKKACVALARQRAALKAALVPPPLPPPPPGGANSPEFLVHALVTGAIARAVLLADSGVEESAALAAKLRRQALLLTGGTRSRPAPSLAAAPEPGVDPLERARKLARTTPDGRVWVAESALPLWAVRAYEERTKLAEQAAAAPQPAQAAPPRKAPAPPVKRFLRGPELGSGAACAGCGAPYDQEAAALLEEDPWIACTVCRRWYHGDCVSLAAEDILAMPAVAQWACPACCAARRAARRGSTPDPVASGSRGSRRRKRDPDGLDDDGQSKRARAADAPPKPLGAPRGRAPSDPKKLEIWNARWEKHRARLRAEKLAKQAEKGAKGAQPPGQECGDATDAPSNAGGAEQPAADGEAEIHCPVCQRPDYGRPLVGCDACERWYHHECSGVDPKDLVGRANFLCRECRGLKVRSPSKARIDAAIEAAQQGAPPHDWAKRADAAIEALAKKKAAQPFLEPVPATLEGYREAIKKPMDLKTVSLKLKKGRYPKLDALVADVGLIWDNCRQFNEPTAPVVADAAACEALFARLCSEAGLPGFGGDAAADGGSKASGSTQKPGAAWRKAAGKVLKKMQNMSESYPFWQPVSEEEAPDYAKVVPDPIDLGAVSDKLREEGYATPAAFRVDAERVWKNALLYNGPQHPLAAAAKRCAAVFQELCKAAGIA